MKILVAVDGSQHTKRMLAYIAAHDEWLGPSHTYTVIHSVVPIPPHAASSVARDLVKTYYESEAQKVFKPIRSFFKQQGIEANFCSRVGNPAEEIARLVKKSNSDLLMIGSHGHGALTNLILGSVVTKILAICAVPVLIVR